MQSQSHTCFFEGITNVWYALNEREQQLVRQLDLTYINRFGNHPSSDEQLVYFTGDRFEFSKTWSAVSGKIPTFRKNPSKYIHRATMTFLTDEEKLAALGWPVTDSIATQMNVARFPCLDARKAACMCGNAMHITVAGITFLVGMTCFGKV